MNLKVIIKRTLIRCGLDIRIFTPSRSDAARLKAVFDTLAINLVIDVGANSGQYANYLRSIGYQKRILCFEPLTSAYASLKNFALKDRLIEVAPQMALGDTDSEISINVARNSESSSILPMLAAHLDAAPQSDYVDTETVPIRRLDSVFADLVNPGQAVFLKIDAQGYEKKILQGAMMTLSKIKGIQLEMSLVELYKGEPLYREMIDLLESFGYELYDLSPTFANKLTGRVYQVDGIFVQNNIN